MNTYLLEQVRCPITDSKMHYDRENELLVTNDNCYAYPVINGIPLLISEEAIDLKKRKLEEKTLETANI